MKCILCAFETEVDDQAITGGHGRCICVRCYNRETNNEIPMPKSLYKEIISTLATIAA